MEDNTTSQIPPWERYTLTIPEAADYYHIGEKRLYRLASEQPDAEFIVLVGNKVLLKRRFFEEYLDGSTCI